MNKWIVGGIVILLLLGVAMQQQPSNTSQALPTLPSFALQDVVSLRIVQQDKLTVDTKREGNAWVTVQDGESQSGTVKAAVVEQLLFDLQMMQPKRVASSKPEHQSRFSVTEAAGSRVVLKGSQGDVLLDVIIGKPATDLVSTYIRISDSNTVMTVNKTLTWQVKRTADSWLAKDKDIE